ncbi:MAG TPA: PTPA-CTERM sorting domain-containing protein [Trichocoleus sp.]|jgi:hypothetical protein
MQLQSDFATSTNFNQGQWSLGFEFTANNNISVKSLGFYDDLKNDLTESHAVGIFDSLGNLLVSGTVNPGDTLDGWFRYSSVAPTLLQAGQNYFVAATTGSENYTWDVLGFTVDPNITFIRDAYAGSSMLVFPSGGPSVANGYFGPNFQFDATPVPTPALLPGLVGMGIAALHKKRKGEAVEQSAEA